MLLPYVIFSFRVFLAFLALDRVKNSKSVSYNKFLHSDFIPCVQSQPAIRRCPPRQASSGLVRPDVCGVLSGNFAGPPHAQAEVGPPRAGLVGVLPSTGAPGQMVNTIILVLLLCVVLSHSCDLLLTFDAFCHVFRVDCLLVICKEREEAAGSCL